MEQSKQGKETPKEKEMKTLIVKEEDFTKLLTEKQGILKKIDGELCYVGDECILKYHAPAKLLHIVGTTSELPNYEING